MSCPNPPTIVTGTTILASEYSAYRTAILNLNGTGGAPSLPLLIPTKNISDTITGIDANALDVALTSLENQILPCFFERFLETFSPTAINVGTDTITIPGIGTKVGIATPVWFSLISGTAPGGLVANTIYYTILVDANNIKLATTTANAVNNVPINITSVGTGSFRLERALLITNPAATYGYAGVNATLAFKVNFIPPSTYTVSILSATHFTTYCGPITYSLGGYLDTTVVTSPTLTMLPAFTEAITPASINTGTDQITVASNTNTWTTGMPVRFAVTSGTAPSPLVNNTVYYVIRVSSTAIRLATSLANARSNIFINLTTTGSGTFNLDRIQYQTFTFAWRYRKGCCNGNDNLITVTWVVNARCGPTTLQWSNSGALGSQWGC